MRRIRQALTVFFTCHLVVAGPYAASADPTNAIPSVVSVLPVWPNSNPATGAPEGSGIVYSGGVIVTAWHVVASANRIDIQLSDGRIVPARLVAADPASDIAVLKTDVDLPAIEISADPALADRACTISNAFGLGLSITCGVISAQNVTNAGFNPIEDFVQTDASVNPGSSGGALVDADGRLVGMLSAIFASEGDTNTGVSFAVSTDLLSRVADALLADGVVDYPDPGWRLGPASEAQLSRLAAPQVVQTGGAAAIAGIMDGDIIVEIGERRIHTPRDAHSALAILPSETGSVRVLLERNDLRQEVFLPLNSPETLEQPSTVPQDDCSYARPICTARQAVFPVSSYDPIASATRIGPNLLVTNRHVVGDREDATVFTPDGPRDALVVPSAYEGDLALLDVVGLPQNGQIFDLGTTDLAADSFSAIGADIALQQVRVFDPGSLIALPADDEPLGRLHVTAQLQPGVSGGALVDEQGHLLGIAVGGGDGRYEAIPVEQIRELLEKRKDATARDVTKRLGEAFVTCAELIESANSPAANLSEPCSSANNAGQLLEAGRVLARAGEFEAAATLHNQAVHQVPNSINARISLLVSLQLGARFEEMTEHARWLLDMAPEDPQALRFGIQAGVWGGAPDLAEVAYQALLKIDPQQAQAARRFIDNAPPAPPRRN